MTKQGGERMRKKRRVRALPAAPGIPIARATRGRKVGCAAFREIAGLESCRERERKYGL